MKTLKTTILTLFTAFSIISCGNNDDDNQQTPAATCDTTNTEFKQLFTAVATAPLNHDVVTYDSEIHSYSFQVTSPKKICSVGYRSQPALSTTPYRIEVWDETPTTPVLVGSLSTTFSVTTTSYVSFSSVIPLVVGNRYNVKRIQTSWAPNIGSTIGRLAGTVTGAPLTGWPYTFGSLKITGSSLYQNAGTQTDWAIPYIDIVFE